MPWSGGNYTKGNNGTGGWAGDAAAGIGIEAGRHDTQDNDFATGINQCLNKDGSNAATGNLNIGGFKVSNMATGTATGDATTLGQIQAGVNTQSTTLAVTNTRFSADTTGPVFSLQKSRGASVGTNTIVVSGDTLGTVNFLGANGSSYTAAASIAAVVDGTPGATNDMPGRLVFSTTADGSGTLTERLRITADGSSQFSGRIVFNTTATASGTGIYASAANTLNFATNSTSYGSVDSSGYWYLAGSRGRTTALAANAHIDSGDGGIYRSTSSLKYKTDVRDYDKGLDEALQLRPVYYKGKTNGDTQFAGLIAEEVDAAGLTEFVMYDEAGQPDALAYQNMVALLLSAIKDLNGKVDALEARVAALEA